MATSSPKKRVCALIVIDMAREQLYPGGVGIVPDSWKGYSNILTLAKEFPKERVFDSRLWIEDGDDTPIFEMFNLGKAGSLGAMLVDELKDLEGTFEKKIQYSAFFGSQLHEHLQSQGVTTLFLTGIHTNYCVFATALDAFYLRYEIFLVEDAAWSYGGEEGHKEGIEDFRRFFQSEGTVLTTIKAIQVIENSK